MFQCAQVRLRKAFFAEFSIKGGTLFHNFFLKHILKFKKMLTSIFCVCAVGSIVLLINTKLFQKIYGIMCHFQEGGGGLVVLENSTKRMFVLVRVSIETFLYLNITISCIAPCAEFYDG